MGGVDQRRRVKRRVFCGGVVSALRRSHLTSSTVTGSFGDLCLVDSNSQSFFQWVIIFFLVFTELSIAFVKVCLYFMTNA